MYSFPHLEPVCCSMSSSNCCFLTPDLHTDFSRGRSGGLVFPSLSEFSTVYCDPHISSVKYSQILMVIMHSVLLGFLGVFCIIQLDYTSLISSSNFLVAYLGFSMYSIIEKAREFQKNIYFCFIDYAKVFDCVDHKKLWKILQETGLPDHLTCLLRNLYAGQEAS